jgi:hypothetical protein
MTQDSAPARHAAGGAGYKGDRTMPGDRGTLTRGAQPAQDNGRRPTAPGSRRPPQVARERKPALAALALLLIAGGALGAAYLVLQSGHRVAAIEVTQQLGAGERIPPAALREVDIASGGGLSYVPWSQAGQVTQFYAATAIPSGTLLTSPMVARVNGLASGQAVVGLALKDGQLPDGLQAGDHVNVYQVSDATQSCPGTPGSTLASNAVVLGIGIPPAATSSSSIDVRVALDPSVAGVVTCNAANNNVAVAVLPGPAGGAG